jgi:hypothetical protein
METGWCNAVDHFLAGGALFFFVCKRQLFRCEQQQRMIDFYEFSLLLLVWKNIIREAHALHHPSDCMLG